MEYSKEKRDRLVADIKSESTPKDSLMSTDDKLAYESGDTDSGYISTSNILLYSGEIKPGFESSPIEEEEQQETTFQNKQVEEEQMRFDSGVDVGLSESLSGLSLRCSANLNNLDKNSKLFTQEKEQFVTPRVEVVTPQEDTWERYFQQDQDGDTLLHTAIACGFVEAVYALIRLAPSPCLLDLQNEQFQAPLHIAVATRQARLVRVLLAAGADPRVRDHQGNTPLHLVSATGHLPTVQAVITPIAYQEINALGLSYATPSPPAIELELWNYDGLTCVHIAAINGHINILRHLVFCGADINAREGKGRCTALHIACERNDLVLLQYLLTECKPFLELEYIAYGKCTAYQLARTPTVRMELERFGANTDFDSSSESESDESDTEISSYKQPQFKETTSFSINASA